MYSSDYLNVVGDWIYYTDIGRLYKINTDGSGRTVID